MKSRTTIPTNDQRVLLSEVLPYEVPPIFSNRRLYRFLVDNKLTVNDDRIHWVAPDASVAHIVKLLLGAEPSTPARPELAANAYSLPSRISAYTIPYSFPIGRNDGQSRSLSIVHPKNQLDMVRFYKEHSPAILGLMDRSRSSLRRPVGVSRYSFANDQLHKKLLASWGSSVETSDREYENVRSYFTYERYDNIYKFYESEEFQGLEKRYSRAARLDVSQCFDSIYTHSMPWAIYDKHLVKNNLNSHTFGEDFDKTMQLLNYNETNGIVIGPEFSRIFAEIILQTVDLATMRALDARGVDRSEYRLLRYVDDYFIFSNRLEVEALVEEALATELKRVNLHLQMAKRQSQSTPVITPISIAKLRISRMLKKRLQTKSETATTPRAHVAFRSPKTFSKRLATEYKLILRETDVASADILNYTLSATERRVVSAIRRFAKGREDALDEVALVNLLASTIEFAFFAYSSSPRVNPTVKLSRIVNHVVSALPNIKVAVHHRHLLMDLLNRELVAALERVEPSQHRQLENLYLWTAIRELGAKYLLDEKFLLRYFSISVPSPGKYKFDQPLSHFAAMTLLHYIGGRTRYSQLRLAIANHIAEKVALLPAMSGERVLLVLDAIGCPHLSDTSKQKILRAAGYRDATTISSIIRFDREWFICWNRFDLGRELDVKRNQEVY